MVEPTTRHARKVRQRLIRALMEHMDVETIACVLGVAEAAVVRAIGGGKVVRLRLPTFMVEAGGPRNERCLSYGQCLSSSVAQGWTAATCPSGCERLVLADRAAELLRIAASRSAA